MRTVKVTVELPQSAELAKELLQSSLSEHDPIVKKLLEDILDQLRADYAKNGP